ncbi:MAG TPA: hypothetical protein VHB74_14185 [Devosia sp.]|nr:hypothetical protein [Devosia sp.]
MRTLLWVVAGVLLGGIIHIVVILSVPAVATHNIWARMAPLAPLNKVVLLPPLKPGEANPLQLDPALSYAVCRLNLKTGPGVLTGTLPDAFWSLAIYNPSGAVSYSITNRDGIGKNLNLGIFNADQTKLLAQQEIEVDDGLLIVESNSDDIFVVIRLMAPYDVVRPRYEKALSAVACGNIKQ